MALRLDDIEREVDRVGLRKLLALLADICYMKAEHVGTNWDDPSLASAWQRAGDDIYKIVDKSTAIKALSRYR